MTKSTLPIDDTLDRLIAMTASTNLVALDKTLHIVAHAHRSYSAARARCDDIATRISKAAQTIGELGGVK